MEGNTMGKPSKKHFSFKRLTIEDLDTILHVQKIVVDSLEDPSILAALTPEEYTFLLNNHGEIIGAFDQDKLIAIRAVLEPPIDEEHLGLDLGLSGDELTDVLYQEISMVLPSYRGHGLQQQLAKHIMKVVEQSSKAYTHICATVAPTNIPSLKDKFKQGMHTVVLKKTYGDKWRYTFAKPMKEIWEFDDSSSKSVPLHDLHEHQRLLDEGWYGVKLVPKDESYAITYQRRKSIS